MKPSTYFRELVEPAIAEFEAEPTSVRRAYAACLFAYHFADAVAAHRGPRRRGDTAPIVRDLARRAPGFETVQGVATMAKHVEVTDPKVPVRPRIADTHLGPRETRWLDAAGERVTWVDAAGDETTWHGGGEVVKTRDARGRPVDICWCLQDTRAAIVAYLRDDPGL